MLRDPIKSEKVQLKLFEEQSERDKKSLEYLEERIIKKKTDLKNIEYANIYAKDIYEVLGDNDKLSVANFFNNLKLRYSDFDKNKLEDLIKLWLNHELIRYNEEKREYAIGLTLFSNKFIIDGKYTTDSELSMKRYIKRMREQNQ